MSHSGYVNTHKDEDERQQVVFNNPHRINPIEASNPTTMKTCRVHTDRELKERSDTERPGEGHNRAPVMNPCL